MTSASPSEDDDPEEPENPSGRKKKEKRKTDAYVAMCSYAGSFL